MKIYRGARSQPRNIVTVTDPVARSTTPLDPRHDLRNHSPDGFEWGYGGSGPAQLALAICSDHLGDDKRAQEVYQDFKFKVIGRLQGDTWELTAFQVRDAIDEILNMELPID